jgi:hypothetical protein
LSGVPQVDGKQFLLRNLHFRHIETFKLIISSLHR